jgi:hypothetical protein
MTEQKQIKGFVVVPPGDAAWKLGYWTFAPTAGEAWFRKIGYEVHDIERPRMIQAWHDKGHNRHPQVNGFQALLPLGTA